MTGSFGKKLFIRIFFLLLVIAPAVSLPAQSPVINEVLPSNHSVNMDPDGYAFSDWIELYNPSSATYDLTQHYLSDDREHLKKWFFPYKMTISPGEYLLLWADGEDYHDLAVHLNFRLNKQGGTVYLSDLSGRVLDSLSYPAILPDISYGRSPSAPAKLSFFPHPTPGKANEGESAAWLQRSRPPQVTIPGGFYDRSVRVYLFSDNKEAVIRYTLDGSEPTVSSSLYAGPLVFDHTAVLRAATFEPGRLRSHVITHTYLIHEEVSLPVVSLTMDPHYFWDDSVGFYVEGTNGLTGWQTGHGPSPKSNFNRDWKRPMHIEFYDESHRPAFSTDGEVKVYGGWTRAAVIKSLAIYTYDPIDYKLFPERSFTRYTSFLLRNGGNEWAKTRLRDAVLQSLAINEVDVDLQANRPAVLFINGTFWGVLNIREKINADYVRTLHGVDQDSIDYIESYRTVKAGDMIHYRQMMDFLSTHDLSDPVNYNKFSRMVDVEECLNYFMTGIYSGHGDWIYNNNNNLRLWRPRTDDGRWRWLLYDTDGAFTTSSGRGIADAIGKSTILAAILRNAEGKKYFIDKFTALLNSSFAPERALHMIDSLKGLISRDMPRHIAKWKNTDADGNPASWKTPGSADYIQSEDGYGGPCLDSYAQWEGYFSAMQNVARVRAPALLNELHSYFSLGDARQVSLTVSGQDAGIIEVNGVLHRDLGRPDTWFEGQQLRLSAVAAYGHRFRGWYAGGVQYTTLVDSGAVWHYLDDGSDAGTAWQAPSFDDSGWKSGPAQLGYGDGDEATVVSYGPDAGNKYLTTYFRKRFTVEDSVASARIRLELLCDDGAIVYLNGTEVIRQNMADGTIGYQTAALSAIGGDSESAYSAYTLAGSLLRQGENVLAVEIHQVSPVSSDISFDLRLLKATTTYSGTLVSSSPTFTQTLHSDLSLVAVFDPAEEDNTLHINEIVARNHSYPSYSPTATSDWIELYNSGEEAIPLHDLYLTNDPANPQMCRIPEETPGTVIAPHGYYVLWADGSERPGNRHLNFKLHGKGGTVALYLQAARQMVLLDTMSYTRQAPDVSLSRIPDGTGPWQVTDRPTPGRENVLFFRQPVANIFINEFHTTVNPNDNEWIELYNDNDMPVDAGGLFLTTMLERPLTCRIPPNRPWQTVIPAKGYLVISNRDAQRWDRLLLPYRLDPAGGEIGLSQMVNGEAEYLDYLHYGAQEENVSRGRVPDGEGPWQELSIITPGQSNGVNAREEIPGGEWINVYPNPSRGVFHITMNTPALTGDRVTLSVYTLTGRMIHHERPAAGQEIILQLQEAPAGIYLLKITGPQGSFIRKIEIY